MAIALGLDAKLYQGTAGSTATTLIENVRDVTLNLEAAEAQVTTRAADGWRQTVATLKDASVEFEMVWDPADSNFIAIRDAFLNNTALAFFIADQESGQGLDADFSITGFTRTEPLEDAIKVQVTIKPTYSTRAPTWSS